MTSRPPSESPPRSREAKSPKPKVTRGNFEALAKGLFRVTPEAYAEAEKQQKRTKGGALVFGVAWGDCLRGRFHLVHA